MEIRYQTVGIVNVEVSDNDKYLLPLLYTTGYVPHKLIHRVNCEECKNYLVTRINIWILMDITLLIFNV